MWKVFNEIGFDKEEARRIIMVQNGNVLIDMTRGIVHLPEVIEYIVEGFKEVMDQGPLAWEPGIMMVAQE